MAVLPQSNSFQIQTTVPQSPRAVPSSPQAWNGGLGLPGANARSMPAPLMAVPAGTASGTGTVADTPAAATNRPQPVASPTMVHRLVNMPMVPPNKQPAPPSPAHFFRQVGSPAAPWARLPQTPVQTHRSCFQGAQHVQTPVQTFRSALPSPRNFPSEPWASTAQAQSSTCGQEASNSSPNVHENEPGPEFSSPTTSTREVGSSRAGQPGQNTPHGTEVSSPSKLSSPSKRIHDGVDSDAEQSTMDGETIKKLHKEIGSLRSELEALRGFLDDGGSSSVGQALKSIWGSTSIDLRIDEAEEEVLSPRSPRDGRRVPRSPGASSDHRVPSSPVALSMSTPPRPQSPQLPRRASKQALHEKPSVKNNEKASPREGHSGLQRLSTTQSESSLQAQRSSSASRLAQQDMPRNRSFSGLEQTDCIDDMWCNALRCFPNHPHWTLLKVSSGVYRLGSRTGKKILCQISHGGLQVRVGGGWMGANSFLQKYGPQYMGSGTGLENNLDSSPETPVNMERLLVPTKSWANKIGINTSPDLREMRRPGELQPQRDCQASPR